MKINQQNLTVVLGCGLFALANSAFPQGMSGMGGQGGGESDVRLCADFATSTAPYTNSDGNASEVTPFQYCDGFDGEILMGDDFLKLSTTTRNPAERTVRVMINSGDCTTADPVLNPDGSPRLMNLSGDDLDAFYGFQQNAYVLPDPNPPIPGDPICAPDPFGAGGASSLECLVNSGQRHNLMELTEADGTVFQAWRLGLSAPGEPLKKAAEFAFVFQFGGGLGSFQCQSPHGLPVAIRCKDDLDSDHSDCESYELKTFRACVADYDASKGGNWHQAYTGCEMNTEITFTAKP